MCTTSCLRLLLDTSGSANAWPWSNYLNSRTSDLVVDGLCDSTSRPSASHFPSVLGPVLQPVVDDEIVESCGVGPFTAKKKNKANFLILQWTSLYSHGVAVIAIIIVIRTIQI